MLPGSRKLEHSSTEKIFKNVSIITIMLLSVLLSNNTYAQNISAGTQNAINRLDNEYFPRLKKMKANIETNRSTIPSAKCNEYIDELNKSIKVWNSIPESDLKHKKIQPIRESLREYIAFGNEARELFKERQEAEKKNNVTSNSNSNNNSSNTAEVESNFKVGDKVSVVSGSTWSWGNITGFAGKEFQARAHIANEDIEVDIKKEARYLSVGKEKVGKQHVFEYWPYHEFFEDIKELDLNQFYRMIFEVVGKNASPGKGTFTANGRNLSELQKEIKLVEEILKKYPPFPEDAQRYADRSSRDVNAVAYKIAIDGKDKFLQKKIEDGRIKEYLRILYNGKFSPESISTNKQLKYLDTDKTIFWMDILCVSPDNIKKAVIKDMNDFLKEMNMPQKGESYLEGWDEMIASKEKHFLDKMEKDPNWKSSFPYTDSRAMTLYKRDVGGNPSKILFSTSAPKVKGGIQNKDKKKSGVAFFKKKGDCPYYFYVRFSIFEKHQGNGVYDAPKCLFTNSGYTKSMP